MERHEPNEHTSLNLEEFTPFSMDSTSTFVASPPPATTVHHRQSYQRVPSMQEQDTSYHGPKTGDVAKGLGIEGIKAAQGPSIEISFSEENSPAVPGSAGFLPSPSLSRSSNKAYRPLDDTPEDEGGEFHTQGRSRSPSLFRPFTADSERETLRQAPRTSILSPYGPTGKNLSLLLTLPVQKNQVMTEALSQRYLYGMNFRDKGIEKTSLTSAIARRGEFASVLILMASAWSTIFSAIWLGLATGKPHYNQMITNKSRLQPTTASLLVAAFAKTIELTFVTSFVAFLGQLLSQRAFRKTSSGITVAEMQMRTWILQPGTLFTHAAAVRYAAVTFLGALSVFAALIAMFYTTASDALVSPKLKYGSVHHRVLYGNVNTKFGNTTFIQQKCAIPLGAVPVTDPIDPLHRGQTCNAIENSGEAYHNYAQYLANWTERLRLGEDISTDLRKRPLPVGTLFDNTTVQGDWIDVQDMTENSNIFKRVVNNVSMAFPHAGVFGAAMDPFNRILQPQDLDGLGDFVLEASVPSPAINVLCAAMSEEDLEPIVMSKWPAYRDKKIDVDAIMNLTEPNIPRNDSWHNTTVVDGIFRFGDKYGRKPPAFPILPEEYNTILNFSSYPLNTDSLYLLARANATESKITDGRSYALCSMRVSLSPKCSTIYHSTLSGGHMETHCEDSHNPLMYSRTMPNATSGVYNNEWRDVAVQWGLALSLNGGLTNNQASNARLLAQLIPTKHGLDPKLPSIAEALAVLAGNTLLMSTTDTPFIHYWNHPEPDQLTHPVRERFDAALKVQDYSSGGTQKWQGIFYIVLASVFCLNLLCLGYFITHTGLVTDFMETQNLFALSLNSPPSQVLEGTCGGGPRNEHYRSRWHILMNQGEHFYIESTDDPSARTRRGQQGWGHGNDIELNGGKSPVADMYNRLSKKRSSIF